MTAKQDLDHMTQALRQAGETLKECVAAGVTVARKSGGSPVTEADLAVDRTLKETLLRPGEGWLSEESADDPARLGCRDVWIVDPIDGTKEFVAGIPEWCVSIGLVRDGVPVAGGVYNPAAGQMIVGAQGEGVFLNGEPVEISQRTSLDGALVLASRSEVDRGEWKHFEAGPLRVQVMGSVAYKLGLVAAGLCDATWTLVPKSEWDVAGGVALVRAAGGDACKPDGTRPTFNHQKPKLPGLLVSNPRLLVEIRSYLAKNPNPDAVG